MTTFYEYKPDGRLITDEILTFQTLTDEPTGVTGLIARSNCRPLGRTALAYSAISGGGTNYPIEFAGTAPSSGKILLLDRARGVFYAGTGVPTTVYLTYTGDGSPISAALVQAMASVTETFPLSGVFQLNKTLLTAYYANGTVIKNVELFLEYPTTSDLILRLSDGTSYIDITHESADNNYSKADVDFTIASGGTLTVSVQDEGSGDPTGRYIRLSYGA